MNCDKIDINYNLKIRIMDYDKLDEVLKVSDPFLVARKLKKYYGKDAPTLYLSHNKTKKYLIFHPETNKKINFGSIYYEDFTKHLDEKRRLNFLKRNHKWKDAKMYSAAHLSYYLMW